MTATNDITGDSIKSRVNTRTFEDNFDRIFGKKDKKANEYTANEQRKVLAASDGSVPGIPSACDDYGNTDIEYDGGVK